MASYSTLALTPDGRNERQWRAPLQVRIVRAVIRSLPIGRYTALKALRGLARSPFLMRLPAEAGGYLFGCDLRDGLAREVCFTGCHEIQETILVKAVLGPGMSFVDVGANWGYFTLLAASLVRSTGRVVSLEPDPRRYAALGLNLALNDLKAVAALPVAAAGGAGVLALAGYDEAGDNWGLSRLIDPARTRPGTTIFPVVTDALDALLDERGVDTVDLLKLDVEGAEALVLRGMRAGIARERYRRILMELHPTILAERGESTADVIYPLAEAGYQAWWIDHSRSTTRRLQYRPSPELCRFLRPVEPEDVEQLSSTEVWPHVLWLARGTPPPE